MSSIDIKVIRQFPFEPTQINYVAPSWVATHIVGNFSQENLHFILDKDVAKILIKRLDKEELLYVYTFPKNNPNVTYTDFLVENLALTNYFGQVEETENLLHDVIEELVLANIPFKIRAVRKEDHVTNRSARLVPMDLYYYNPSKKEFVSLRGFPRHDPGYSFKRYDLKKLKENILEYTELKDKFFKYRINANSTKANKKAINTYVLKHSLID